MTKTISILGCGWLGLPLAAQLAKAGWTVKGSTTSSEKLQSLKNHRIHPYLINLNDSPPLIDNTFFDSTLLVVNLPPGKVSNTAGQYKALCKKIENSAIQKVIFISSTSAYPDTIAVADEAQTDKLPDHFNKTLSFERLFQSMNLPVCIIRFGGLVGPQRHPGRFFSQGKAIPNAQAPVNIIHLSDCIGVISFLLDKGPDKGIFNACASGHPSKAEFYSKACTRIGYPHPTVMANNVDNMFKSVDSSKIRSLGYCFEYDDPLLMLDSTEAF